MPTEEESDPILALHAYDLRRVGFSRQEIATAMGLDISTVERLLSKVLKELQVANASRAEEAYQLQDMRLEELYRRVHELIVKAEGFDDRLFKTAITILERQAKLLGLDKTTRSSPVKLAARDQKWMDEATPSELVAEVESYGIEVPARFKLPQIA